jgi:hypothetical protein
MMIYSVRLGVTLGIIWAVSVFVLSYIASDMYAGPFFKGIASIYPGCHSPTLSGRAICAAAAFADSFSLGLLIGLIYNRLPIKR